MIESVYVIFETPLQSSVAVALPVFDGWVEAVWLIVTLAGQVIVGALVFRTMIVWVKFVTFPQLSIADQLR